MIHVLPKFDTVHCGCFKSDNNNNPTKLYNKFRFSNDPIITPANSLTTTPVATTAKRPSVYGHLLSMPLTRRALLLLLLLSVSRRLVYSPSYISYSSDYVLDPSPAIINTDTTTYYTDCYYY